MTFVLNLHIDNEDICSLGYSVLENISFGSKQSPHSFNGNEETTGKNKERARKSGVIAAITRSMKKYINNVEMCRTGCNLLRSIVTNDCKHQNFLFTG